MLKSQAVSTGEGVSRGERFSIGAPDDTTVVKEITPEAQYVPVGVDEWVSTPILVDQFTKKGLWKLGPVQAATFNISDSDQLAEYNALLSKTHPEGSPRILLADKVDTKFFDGRFYALVHYHNILYRSVIKK